MNIFPIINVKKKNPLWNRTNSPFNCSLLALVGVPGCSLQLDEAREREIISVESVGYLQKQTAHTQVCRPGGWVNSKNTNSELDVNELTKYSNETTTTTNRRTYKEGEPLRVENSDTPHRLAPIADHRVDSRPCRAAVSCCRHMRQARRATTNRCPMHHSSRSPRYHSRQPPCRVAVEESAMKKRQIIIMREAEHHSEDCKLIVM